MKKTRRPVAMLACTMALLLTACGNKIHQKGPEDRMDLADFSVYAGGSVVLPLEDTDTGNFVFGWADLYGLDADDIATRRGICLSDSDYEIVKQYGGIMCQIDYKNKGMWHTVYDVSFEDFYGGPEYQKEYVVTFYAFQRNGRMQAVDDEQYVSLYVGGTRDVEVWGLSFCVEGGTIKNIESFTTYIE